MRIVWWVVVLASIGCKRDDAPTCPTVARTLATSLVPERDDVPPATAAEIRTNLAGALEARCRQDRWSSSALECLRGAQSQPDVERCAMDHLSAEPFGKLVRLLAIDDLRLPAPPPRLPPPPKGDFAPSDIPECQEYRAAIIELSACDAIPVGARNQMRDAWNQVASQWNDLAPEARAAAVQGCKAAADATKQAAAACK